MDDMHRRVKALRISVDFLTMLLGKNVPVYYVNRDALPDDSRVVGCQMVDLGLTEFQLLIRSSEFDPVPEGARIPEICPQLTRYDFPVDENGNATGPSRNDTVSVTFPVVKFREFL